MLGDAWDIENSIDCEVSSSCDLKSNFTLAIRLFRPIITKSYYNTLTFTSGRIRNNPSDFGAFLAISQFICSRKLDEKTKKFNLVKLKNDRIWPIYMHI